MSVAQSSVHWKRLLEPPALPGWLTLGWKLVNALSNIDYLQTHLSKVWQFCTSPTGNVILIFLGLGWLAAVVLWPREETIQTNIGRAISNTGPTLPAPAISTSDLLTNQAHEQAKIRLQQLADDAMMLIRFAPTKNTNQTSTAHMWAQFVGRWRASVINILQTYWGNDAVAYFASADGFNKHEAVGDILEVTASPYRELLHCQKTLKELQRTLH